MGKRLSNRAQRRKIERNLTKGKVNDNLNDETLLYQLKYILNETQANNLKETLPPERIAYIDGNILPNKYSDIRNKGKTYAKDDIIKEIKWNIFYFKKYHTEINNFLELETLFDNYFLAGNYKKAKEILDKIESNICCSHWSIEKRLMIAEYEVGFKKNKEELTAIISEENDFLTNLLAKHQSVRIEKNLSHFKYDEIISRVINQYGDLKIKEYLEFKLNFFSKVDYDYKGFFLNIENSSSIIDRYNTFISLSLLSLSEKEENTKQLNILIESIKELSQYISDERLVNILLSKNIVIDFKISEINNIFIEILDQYTNGKYEIAIKLIKKYLVIHTEKFELYEIYIKSLINLNRPFENIFIDNSLAGQCLNDLYNIISKNNKTQQAFINSYKLISAIGVSKWSYKYYTFLNNSNSINDKKLNFNKYAFLNSNIYNPILSIFIDGKTFALDYLKKLQSQTENISTIKLWENFNLYVDGKTFKNNINSVDPFRKELYNIAAFQVKKEYNKALNHYRELEKKPEFKNQINHPHNIEVIGHAKIICLLNIGDFLAATILTTDILIANQHFKYKLKYDYLLNEIVKFDNEDIMKDISSAIILHMYENFVNPNDIWVAYDNFLCAHGLNYPKEIESILSNFDEKKVIYFLRYICVQSVYDSSYSFDNQDQLDNERIEICSLLSKIDEDNFDVYINEISEISRDLLVRKGIKQIDESKIYVDVTGIKRLLDLDIRESFERNMNLLSLSLDQIEKLDLNSENVIVPYYGKSNETNKVEFKESNIKITSYSRFQQFKDMFIKIRDKFIASNEFGIDTYLSMRIRHGTLQGEIRSVFENHNLVTKKEDTTEKYKDNKYWFKNNVTINKKFNHLMAAFSKNIDEISDDLKNNKLQIRTEKKGSNGLFNYSYSNDDLLKIFTNRIGAINNYEEFFDEIISILWERTEINLSDIRNHISDNIKDNVIKLLNEISSNIEGLTEKNNNADINELVRNITQCRTDIKNELDKIAGWFRRTNNKSINEFYIDLPVNAALTILKRLFKEYGNLSPQINIDCKIKFDGEYFQHFTYIMQNFLHNIFEHSKLSCNNLDVTIDIYEENLNIILSIQNNFSENIDLDEINAKIHDTRSLLKQTQFDDKTRAEKGTGYLKINKTLKSDLSRKDIIILINEVNDSRFFKTTVQFNINGLQKIEK